MKPCVGIVTVTYNSEAVLDDFLASVEGQSHEALTVVAIDNASRDDSVAKLRAWPDLRLNLVVNESNVGVAEGNNQGIAYCRDAGIDWVLLLNNDTVFDPNLIERLLATAASTCSRVIVPRILYHERPDLNWYAGGRFSWKRGFQAIHEGERQTSRPDRCRNVDYSPTCCMLVHVSVFESVGVMDPAYFVYWDDVDFCWRLKRAGVRILYDPDVVLMHKVSSLTGGESSDFSTFYYSRNQVYFLRKFFGPLVVHANLALIRVKNRLRLRLGRDSLHQAALRRRAERDGLAMHPPSGN